MIEYQAVITGNENFVFEYFGMDFSGDLRASMLTSCLDFRQGEIRGLANHAGGKVLAYQISGLTHLDSKRGGRDLSARNALVTATFPKKNAVIKFHELLLSCGYNIKGTRQKELTGVL